MLLCFLMMSCAWASWYKNMLF